MSSELTSKQHQRSGGGKEEVDEEEGDLGG